MTDEPKNNVVDFPGITTLNSDPTRILRALSEQPDIYHCWIVIERDNGEMTYHSSSSDLVAAYYALGQWIHKIMNRDFDIQQ